MNIHFTKMQSSGNDFVVLDGCREFIQTSELPIQKWADRHTGIGFDQLLILQPPSEPKLDFGLEIFNSDGSVAEQCGNGTACVAKYVVDERIAVKTSNVFQTLGGTVETACQFNSGSTVETVRVGMGIPTVSASQIPFIGHKEELSHTLTLDGLGTVDVIPIGLGNPHAVTFVKEVANAKVIDFGTAVQRHAAFPNSANVEFVEVLTDSHINLRILERGAGETRGCGSGACASTVAGRLSSKLSEEVRVTQPGGDVQVSWVGPGESVYLTCPVHSVFAGSIAID